MSTDIPLIVFILGTLILLFFAFFVIIFLIVHKKKRYQHLLEKQQMENSYQNQLLLSRIEVQEQSFKYFSEEIHDNIGQLLSIVKMQLYNIRNRSTEQEIVNKATDCTDLLGKAINDLRNISHTLNNGYILSAGLADAVQKELDYICSAKEMQCALHITGEEYSLGNERELLTFRIIQEAIANAVKHAAPTQINIYLDYERTELIVRVSDNGMGFEPGNTPVTGIGLNNMLVRSGLLKAKLEVSSVKDKGSTISLSINKTEEPQAK